MNLRIGRNGVDKVIDGVDEGVFVTDDVTGRPPGAEVRVRRLRTQNGLEPRLVGRITAVAIFQLVHPLETEGDAPLGPVDFPAIEILVTWRQARGLERAVRALGHAVAGRELRQECRRVIYGYFLGPFSGRSFQPQCLRLLRAQ